MPILLMLHGGGRALEDLRELRTEVSLQKLLKIKHLPASSTVGDWLRRMGQEGRGLAGLERANDHLTRQVLERTKGKGYILDVDASTIESGKEAAQWTYQKVKGYQPLGGFLQESGGWAKAEDRLRGLIIADEFGEGNVPAGARAVAFLERCSGKIPAGKKIEAVRSDSAWYQAEVFNWCEERGLRFVICADQDGAVKEAIRNIGPSEWRPYRGGREIAETVHTMNSSQKTFRLVVLRWSKAQPDLFDPDPYFYHAIATNGEEEPEAVVEFYDQGGEIENWIKELKDGFGMDWRPCGETYANAVYFGLGVIAHNLFIAMKMLSLPGSWQRYTIRTVRWRLYEMAGRVLWESRRIVLQLVATVEKVRTLLGARRRVQQLVAT